MLTLRSDVSNAANAAAKNVWQDNCRGDCYCIEQLFELSLLLQVLQLLQAKIYITTDLMNTTLTIKDTYVGMTRNELKMRREQCLVIAISSCIAARCEQCHLQTRKTWAFFWLEYQCIFCTYINFLLFLPTSKASTI